MSTDALESPQTPSTLAEFVAMLPPWDVALDDDPNWLRPTSSYGFTHVDDCADPDQALEAIVAARAAASDAVRDGAAAAIDTGEAKYTKQDYVRLDVLNHYVNGDRSENWDRDGWFGNDYPVVTPWKDGYLVLDGTNRVAADRVAGRDRILVHVVANSRYPHQD